MKNPKKRTLRNLCIVIAVIMIAAIAVCATVYGRKYVDHRMPNFTSAMEIYVYPGMTADDVVSELLDSGIVARPRSLRRAFREEGLLPAVQDGAAVQLGHYTITATNTSIYAARMLKGGWQTPVNLVLSGAIRLRSQIASKISRQMLMDSLTVMNALNDSALLSRYGFTPENVFGLIIPDTYQVYWTDSMESVLDKQKAALDAFWTPENIAKAKALGLTPQEVVILASIVRGESNYVPEYPKIAGVYLNRLHRGMKLQADPTIAFCYNYTLNRILKKHLTVDSPYNTYRHEGLPPAPIYAPGRDAMNAVLNPAGGDYLFFCASPDFNGSHLFAETYQEHLKNARAFQRALNARLAAKNKK